MGPGAAARSRHSAPTRALRSLLNMSPIMSMPPATHCPIPPSSGWLNCAIVLPPWRRASATARAASGLKPWRWAISAMLSAIVVSFVLGADRLYGCGRRVCRNGNADRQPVELHFAALLPKSDLRGVSADIKSWQSETPGVQADTIPEPPGVRVRTGRYERLVSYRRNRQSTDHA